MDMESRCVGEMIGKNVAVVVEDHPLYRDALCTLLKAILGPSSVLTAGTAEEGLKTVRGEPQTRFVFLDMGLPGLRGCEAVAAFRREFSELTLVAVSASEDRREVAGAFRAGADVFVSKTASTEALASVVRRSLNGRTPSREWITENGLAPMVEDGQTRLTPRQGEILTLLCEGYGNKEIGLRLSLAEITVKQHVSALFRVLGVGNRTQAVIAARRLGLREAVPPGP